MCFGRTRSDPPAPGDGESVATGVLRDATFVGFVARRDGVLAAGLEPFPETLRATAFAGFAFRWIDLETAAERLAAFFAGLGFTFAFIAMSPATYTDYAS